jgi:hypothetical protein
LQLINVKLDEMADFIFSRSQENLVKHESVNSGELLTSGFVEKLPNHKRIGYRAPQAVWVEFGTEPHFPPHAPIEAWARKKLGLSDKEATKAGWAICQKIAKEGVEAKPFLRPAYEEARARFNVEK